MNAANKSGEKEIVVGIDLGTTNSEVAWVDDGCPRIITEGDSGIVPSAVGLDANGRLLVGESALNQMLVAPERTIRSIKRKMGSAEKVRLGEVEYTPQEISAMILRNLKERAERVLGRPVRQAVITVPAFFNESQRCATREAGELAGLEVLRILHEPTAASLVYDAERDRKNAAAGPVRILVYDMGGGTFDVSIVEVDNGVIEVKASHGDTHLGGDDFDALLLDHVADRFLEEHGVDPRQIPRARARILRAVERAKRELSLQPFAQLEEEFIAEHEGRPLHLSMELRRDEYEQQILPLIERSMSSVQAAFHEAKLLARDIDRLVLVGGATRTPLIQQMLAKKTGKEPRHEIDPDLCVALGAATEAGLISGEDVGRVLVDITAHSLGVKCIGSLGGDEFSFIFSSVIPKGSALPSTRSEVYYTATDDQTAVDIKVFEGEDRDIRQNVELGTVRVEGLSAVPAGNEIVVQFHLTLDGTLTAKATEKQTGLSRQIAIQRVSGSFSEGEMVLAQKRLQSLHGDGPLEAKSTSSEASVTPGEGTAIIDRALEETVARIHSLFDRMVPEDREDAVHLIERVRAEIAAGRIDEARAAQEELKEMIFYVEEA